MARGYPDYFGQSIWPKYGSPLLINQSSTILSAGTHTLIDISVQGVMFGLVARVSCATILTNIQLKLTIDGQLSAESIYDDVNYQSLSPLAGELLHVTYATGDMLGAWWALSREIPFHDQFKLSLVVNPWASNIVVKLRGMYYVIT